MKAMILAAGKGERMRPLTDTIPKPLLRVKNKTLIEHAIDRVKSADITDLVINVSYRGEQIEQHLGDGSSRGVHIVYSREPGEPLETGGGIAKALPLLARGGEAAFLLVNSDVWCDVALSALRATLKPGKLAHLLLVPNPAHNSKGDFFLDTGSTVRMLGEGESGLTYSGISVLHPQLFHRYAPAREKFPLREVLLPAMARGEITGECYRGAWVDVGTPERLASLQTI